LHQGVGLEVKQDSEAEIKDFPRLLVGNFNHRNSELMAQEKTGLNLNGRELRVEGRLCRVARLDGDDFKFLDDPEPVLAELRRTGLRIDLFTFLQGLPETSPKYSYPVEWDNIAVLRVSTYEYWWTKQINNKTRNMVRQAQKKGILVREVPFDNELALGIWEIYNECPIRQGRIFPHYGKSFEVVREMSATFLDSSVFIGAFEADKLIGFIKLTIDDTGTQAGIMHIMSMLLHRDKAPTNALVAQAVRSCADRNIPHLVYAKFAYGRKVRSSLSDFKERNGFERVDMPRYYVPLTPWGRLALSLGLHRQMADRLPEPVAAKLRDLRSAWYQRKFRLKPEAL
jgi:hypothetical protein